MQLAETTFDLVTAAPLHAPQVLLCTTFVTIGKHCGRHLLSRALELL